MSYFRCPEMLTVGLPKTVEEGWRGRKVEETRGARLMGPRPLVVTHTSRPTGDLHGYSPLPLVCLCVYSDTTNTTNTTDELVPDRVSDTSSYRKTSSTGPYRRPPPFYFEQVKSREVSEETSVMDSKGCLDKTQCRDLK